MRSKERVEMVFEELRGVISQSSPDRFDLIIVFGSYARGWPHEESDLDLYLVTDSLSTNRVQTDTPSDIGLQWSEELPEADLTAITPEEFVKRYYQDEEFTLTVIEEGAYMRGAPRDVREKVDYDPIADDP